MFSVIVKPVIDSVKAWVADQVHKAARQGAAEGLHRFALELAEASALPAPAPEAVPLVMPATARTTEPSGENDADQHGPALDQTQVERLKELIGAGLSQREAARQLGIPESTARTWLRRAG